MKPLHVLSIAGLVVASACSSHGSSALPMPGSTPPARNTGTAATLSIVVPQPARTTSARRPQYVSPSSAQLQVAVNGGAPATYGLTASTPGCGIVSANLTCSFAIAAPPGNDAFALTLTDTAGNVLSRNVVSATLTAGVSTPVDVTLAAVPASVRAVPGRNSGIEGSGTPAYHIPGLFPQRIELQALDADGNVIIGPGAPTFSAPAVSSGSAYAGITPAGSTDPNGYILSAVAGAGGQTVSLSMTAQGIPLNDGTTSAPVSGSTSFTFTPAIAVAGGPTLMVYSVETGNQVAIFSICSGFCGTTIDNAITAGPSGNIFVKYQQIGGLSQTYTIKEFPVGSAVASRTLTTSNGVTGSGGMAVDKNGMLYDANAANGVFLNRKPAQITEFLPGATSPKYSITGSTLTGPQGVAVDGSGNVYVTNFDGTIPVYGSGSHTTALRTMKSTAVAAPTAAIATAAGGLYVLDNTNRTVAYFAPGATTVATVATPALPAQGSSLAYDASGNVWVSIPTTNAIEKFDGTALPNTLSLLQTINAGGYAAWIP
jgi:streptogramin lyase